MEERDDLIDRVATFARQAATEECADAVESAVRRELKALPYSDE